MRDTQILGFHLDPLDQGVWGRFREGTSTSLICFRLTYDWHFGGRGLAFWSVKPTTAGRGE